jgi:NADH:ubiquinone reductase (H+-translocating)
LRDRHAGAAISVPRSWPLGRFGFFKGGFIKGRFAQLSHGVLYRRHQLSLHGPYRAALLWLAERINALVQPRIRIS